MSNCPTCRRRVSLLGMQKRLYELRRPRTRSLSAKNVDRCKPGRLSAADGRAVIGKILPHVALQVTILVAAVGIEVRVPGKIDGQGLVNVVVLKNVVHVGRLRQPGKAPKARHVVRRSGISLDRIAGKS